MWIETIRAFIHVANQTLWSILIWMSLVREHQSHWPIHTKPYWNRFQLCIVPCIRFANGSHIFIRSGGTIDLMSSTTSVRSIEEIIWKLNDSLIEPEQTVWQTKARKCLTKERENCIIETTFGLKIENVTSSDSGNYTCSTSWSTIESAHIYVHVIGRKSFI